MTRLPALVLTCAAMLVCAAPAGAAFPGANGRIVFGNAQDLWAINADGSGEAPLSPPELRIQFPSFSPDGSRIAFFELDSQALWVMDADGTDARQLVPKDANVGGEPSFSPDGRRIATSTPGGLSIFDSNDGTVLASIPAPGTDARYSQPTWNPADPDQIAVVHATGASSSDPDHDIAIVSVSNGTQKALTSDPDIREESLDFAPDGGTILFAQDGTFGNPEPRGIYTVPAAGGAKVRLRAYSRYPIYSPDGTKIVYGDRDPAGRASGALWTMGTDGSNPKHLYTPSKPVEIAEPTWQAAPLPPLSVSLAAAAGSNDLLGVRLSVANAAVGAVGSLGFPSGMGVVQADVAGAPRPQLSPYFAPAPAFPSSIAGKSSSAHSMVFEVLSPGSATLLTRVTGKDAQGVEHVADAAVRVDAQLRGMTEFETHASVVGGLALLMDQVGNARDTAVAGLTDSARKQIAKGGRKNRGLLRSSAFERAFALSLGMKENALSWLTRFQRLERARPEPGYGELAMIFAADGAKAFGSQLQKRMGETGNKLVVGPALFWRDFVLRGKDGGLPRVLWELGDMARAGTVKGGGYLGEAAKFYAHPLANGAELWREMPKLYDEYSAKIAKSIGETELKLIRWGDLANERPRQAMSQFSETLGRIEANILADAFDDLLQDKALDAMKKLTKTAKAVDEGGDLLGGERMTRRLADPKGTFLARNGQVTNKPLPGLGNVTPAQADFLSTTTKKINDKFDVDLELQLRGVNAHSANIKDGIGKVEAIPTKNLNTDDVKLGAPGEWLGQPATYLPKKPKNFAKLPAHEREALELRIKEKTLEYKQFHGLADDPTGKTTKVKKMLKAGGAEVELGSNYKARIQLETTQKGGATLLQYKRLEVNGKPVFDHRKGPRPIVSDFDFHAALDRRTGRNLPAAIRGQVELELMNEFSKAAHEGLIPFGFHGWTHSGFDLASKDFRHVAKYLLMYASEKQARDWARKWAPKFFPELGAIADPRKHERAYRKAIEAMLNGFTRGKHLVKITATEAVFGPGIDPTIGMPLP